MLQRIDIDSNGAGFSYHLTYSGGEKVELHCVTDVLHYLECNEAGEVAPDVFLLCDLINQGETESAANAARTLEKHLTRGGSYPQLTDDQTRYLILALINSSTIKK